MRLLQASVTFGMAVPAGIFVRRMGLNLTNFGRFSRNSNYFRAILLTNWTKIWKNGFAVGCRFRRWRWALSSAVSRGSVRRMRQLLAFWLMHHAQIPKTLRFCGYLFDIYFPRLDDLPKDRLWYDESFCVLGRPRVGPRKGKHFLRVGI